MEFLMMVDDRHHENIQNHNRGDHAIIKHYTLISWRLLVFQKSPFFQKPAMKTFLETAVLLSFKLFHLRYDS